MSAPERAWRPNAVQMYALDLLRAHGPGLVGGNRVHYSVSARCPFVPKPVAKVLLDHGAAVYDDDRGDLPLMAGATIKAAEVPS